MKSGAGKAAGKTRAGRKRVKFELAEARRRKVFVAGTFNRWDPGKHRLRYNDETRKFALSVLLSPGRYEYKFIVDGIWCIDPECDQWTPNHHGSINSILEV